MCLIGYQNFKLPFWGMVSYVGDGYIAFVVFLKLVFPEVAGSLTQGLFGSCLSVVAV